MIQVAKSDIIPAVLIDKGVPEKTENCRLYDASPNDYSSGASTFTILSSIYGHQSVKQKLIDDQHGKCCFCEADFTANGYGDVEHFRPKAGFTKTRTGKLIRPGYYWLAYEWTNLFFSCQICNQRFKKNYFPLEDETNRAQNHTFDYKIESSTLLHPSVDNPENHITFNRHVPVGQSNRGKLSIAGFGIDRNELNRIREAYLQNVRNNIFLAGFDPVVMTANERLILSQQSGQPWEVIESLIQIAKLFTAKAAKDTQPFAAMVRANFPDLI
jgi:uncharacterized protein (TIGR02646 family)